MKNKFLTILLCVALLDTTLAISGCSGDKYATITTDDGVTYTKCTYTHDGQDISGYAVTDYKYTISTQDGYTPTLREITIPSTIHDLPVVKIESSAFFIGEIDTLAIQEGVYYIGTYAFANSGIKQVTLPESIEYIGSNAFNGCDGLMTINIEDTSITEINDGTFNNCSALTYATIPEGVTKIGECAFYSCTNLKYINLPSTITLLSGDSISNVSTTSDFKIYYNASEDDFNAIMLGERPRYDDYESIAKWWGTSTTNPYTIVYDSQYTPSL